jgi:hypothetical protein
VNPSTIGQYPTLEDTHNDVREEGRALSNVEPFLIYNGRMIP